MSNVCESLPILTKPLPLKAGLGVRRIAVAPRVLVVEDDPISQLIMLQQLRTLGCMSRAASFGQEAIEARKLESFGLILLDCRLPDIDGYQTARLIREFEEARSWRRHVAIVAVTADQDRACEQKCLSAGMDAYLQKPVNVGTLRSLLQMYME